MPRDLQLHEKEVFGKDLSAHQVKKIPPNSARTSDTCATFLKQEEQFDVAPHSRIMYALLTHLIGD